MRVTESRMLDLAAAAVSETRSRAALAGETMQSGKRVTRPSDDPVAWAQAARASARQTMSVERGSAMSYALIHLGQGENALASIGENLSRASEVALQLSNGTLTPADRAALLPMLNDLRVSTIAAGNSRGVDGEYLFSGSRSDLPPFDASGNYLGDSLVRSIESSEGATTGATLPGSVLAASSGMDVLKVIDSLITAVTANDIPGMQAASGSLTSAVGQVSSARSQLGARMAALDSANDARQSFELLLADTIATAVDADPVVAAADLARSATALESARVAAEQIVSLVRSAR